MKNFFKLSAMLAIVAGLVLVLGGVWGIVFTYQNVSQENIVTPADASIPETQVRGPFTLMSQAEIIREHTLNMTGGLTFAEMPRMIPVLNDAGDPVLDNEGNPQMQPNTSRDTWITATALTTALNLAVVTYAFSGLVILLGLISIWTGFVYLALSRRRSQFGN